LTRNDDNAFVVLGLGGLKGRRALQQVVLLQLISRINHDIYRTRGRKKLLVIDEAWELLDDPMMEKAIEAAYRKAGKHGASVIKITHSIADLYNSPNSRAIAANSAWQLILQQKAESIDAAIKGGHFKIDSYGAHLLKGVHTLKGKYSEVMIKQSDTDWGIVRLVVNRFIAAEREFLAPMAETSVDRSGCKPESNWPRAAEPIGSGDQPTCRQDATKLPPIHGIGGDSSYGTIESRRLPARRQTAGWRAPAPGPPSG
jgi:hypothetical protein